MSQRATYSRRAAMKTAVRGHIRLLVPAIVAAVTIPLILAVLRWGVA